MTWLRRLALIVLALALVAGGALGWLLYTTSGLRFALARAEGALGGRLAVRGAAGTLAGPLTLADLRWRDAGVDVRVARAHLDWSPWPLLAKRLHVRTLDVDGVDVALTARPPQPPSETPFDLQPPLDLLLDRLRVARVRVTQDRRPAFAADTFDFAGAWTHDGLEVRRLALRAPDGRVDLAGTLALRRGYPGRGRAQFDWKAGSARYAGTLTARSDGARADLALTLAQPAAATLAGTLRPAEPWAWTLALDAPAFAPAPLLGEGALKTLALHLEGRGDRNGGELRGRVDADGHRVLLDPLRFALTPDLLRVTALTLRAPQVPGTLQAHGDVRLKAQPVAAEFAVSWRDVVLPADLAGQALATHGDLHLVGSSARYAAQGSFALGPPQHVADFAVVLDGTPQQIALQTLRLVQPQGDLDARGTLTLQPRLGWDIEAIARRLDPGAFFAGWPGALDFRLASRGTLTDRGPQATLKLDRVGGTLRRRAVRGRADLRLAPDYVVDGNLELASGGSRVAVSGRGGQATDAAATLAIASLGDWLPRASGRLDGRFDVAGRWPRLAVRGQLAGERLAYAGAQIDALRLQADLPDLGTPGGKLDLAAHGAAAAGFAFASIAAHGDGVAEKHALRVDARGAQLGLALALSGSYRNAAWNGTLAALRLEPAGMPAWTLQQPAQLAWRDGAARLSPLCLAAGEPRVCVAGQQTKDGAASASYRLERLPVALIAALAAPAAPLRFDGTLDGSGELRRAADGALSGSAVLRSAAGSIAYPENAGQPLLGWRDLAAEATLSPSAQRVTLHSALADGGRIDGEATVGGAQRALSGTLDANLPSLAFVELLTPQLAAVKGALDGRYTLGGTLDAPRVAGRMALRGFAAEVPAAGLKLHDGELALEARDAAHFAIDGHVGSGDGTLAVKGTLSTVAGEPLRLDIRGENFLAADIPAARVRVSPELAVARSDGSYAVTGRVAIPAADIDLTKLPGGGAAQRSPDVVVVDEPSTPEGAGLPVAADIAVTLGDEVHLKGFGLDGKLGGQLAVRDRRGKATTARGEIRVDGTYKAYGQNLTIERGRLLFAGTPIDDPGLDITAVRKLPDVTPGLRVQGTAQRPVLTVFATPPMEQSEALSYLITGKPLSALKSGEGDMLSSAARALGTAGGDRLAKQIGSRLGLDEAGVASSEALGGAAFSVGKYLSPRLYLGYGVGLFTPGEVVTLRYTLTKKLRFEAQNATTGSRAGLDYRYER
ncbi:pathogenicity protein [Mizugakiibacter sediminis]|uniref:Pathogenicity protein n=2 Tax=Mizugakiibacter sediminis TaxID=1475481 RepID=A0A0K8QP36_9GAMM|nr:translocation/assembly module TamB domain-containing protein [Mizugakiibacter sediminis]GAP66639.1 pathogenicity protein [Mizugakiibacter sediminis]